MGDRGNLPNVLIIGAMKAGTSSLHHYMDLHPEISMSQQKELRFFDKARVWNQGVEWYKSNFVGQAKVFGEATPAYTDYPRHNEVPRKIFSVIPDVKLIYIVRDPVDRMVSEYIHRKSKGRERRSFEKAMSDVNGPLYFKRSMYFLQLEQYLEFFSKENILVVISEQLFTSPRKTMEQVFQFVGVDPDCLQAAALFSQKVNPSSQRRQPIQPAYNWAMRGLSLPLSLSSPTIRHQLEQRVYRILSRKSERPRVDEALRKRLMSYLIDDIDQLKHFTGYSFEEWDLG